MIWKGEDWGGIIGKMRLPGHTVGRRRSLIEGRVHLNGGWDCTCRELSGLYHPMYKMNSAIATLSIIMVSFSLYT